MIKRIGIMTTGGDCSGLNTVIQRILIGCKQRKWTLIGILGGIDGLAQTPIQSMEITSDILPIEISRLSGSILSNNHHGIYNFETAITENNIIKFNKRIRTSLDSLKLDGLILVGGNGSLSLAHLYKEIYQNVSLVCIPKTIDMDIPLTDTTVGFDTAVQQLTSFCDQLFLTAKSHHRWFVVQTMGRDCGKLALNAGVASGASAILIPEIKFDTDELAKHIKNSNKDYGIILVSEGISLRGHSGKPADMISRKLTASGIINKTAFPDYTQRTGDTIATDKILATCFANTALHALENKETYVMVVKQDNEFKTISLSDFFSAGKHVKDPKIPQINTSNAYVEHDDIVLQTAIDMGIYIGKTK